MFTSADSRRGRDFVKIVSRSVAISVFLFASLTEVLGQTWVLTGAPIKPWASIACSADGSKLIASASPVYTNNAQIYLSEDGGTNWALAAVSPVGTSVASSGDGTYLLAGGTGYPIYYSTNSGTTWAQNPVTIFGGSSVAISADGSTMAVANWGRAVLISTNYGLSWNTSSNTSLGDVNNAICSADGRRVAAANNAGMITVSTNRGANWRPPIAIGAHSSSFKGSADLATLISVVTYSNSLRVATSTNFGLTWLTNNLPATNWSSVAISADGTRLVAVATGGPTYSPTGGPIFSSSDRGTTWSSNNAPALNWQAVASSADGNVQFAVVSKGGIWVKRTVAPPMLRMVLFNGPSLSWVIPSASVTLQESPALDQIWTNDTNAPALNLSHLSYEKPISPVGSTGFYRLILK